MPSIVLRRLPVVAALTLVTGLMPFASGVAAAAGATATTPPPDPSGIEFTAFRQPVGYPIVPGTDLVLRIRKSVEVGPLHFAELDGETVTELGSGSGWEDGGMLNGLPTQISQFQLVPAQGTHTYRAIFDATDTIPAITRDLVVDVQPVTTSLTISASPNGPWQAKHAGYLHANLDTIATGVPMQGTLEWRDADTDTVVQVSEAGVYHELVVEWADPGIHHYVVSYSGDATHLPSTSPTFTLTVVADTVDVIGVGVDSPTVYPIKDGYKDTVHAKGYRMEPSSVRVLIYNSLNKIVRGFTVPLGTGWYTVTWNGRSASGALLPSGPYKVVQRLRDEVGAGVAVTRNVTLSHKRIYWSSTYLNKTLAQASRQTTSWIGWQFTLPSAAAYKGLSFQVYGRSQNIPGVHIGGWDYRLCALAAAWSPSCVSGWTTLGYGSNAWGARGLSPTYHRSGRTVRGIAEATGSGYVYRARLRVTYGILK